MSIAYTTVINTSGGRKAFSFLPPHGIPLDDCQSLTLRGEITDRLVPGWPYPSDDDRPPHRVKVRALEKAHNDKQLLVIRTARLFRHKRLAELFKKQPLGTPDK